MGGPESTNQPGKGRGLRGERELEGLENILLTQLLFESCLKRAEEKHPAEMAELRTLHSQKRILDTMISEGAFHGLSRLAIFEACERNDRAVMSGEAQEERFRGLVDQVLYEYLEDFSQLSAEEQAAIAAADPHVEIVRLVAAHRAGILPRDRLIGAFQSAGEHAFAIGIIETDVLKRGFRTE